MISGARSGGRRGGGAPGLLLCLLLGLLLGLMGGCADGGEAGSDSVRMPSVRAPQVEVDTPDLRRAKQRAGVEDCAPGEAGPVEGGLPAVTLACFGGGPEVDLSRLGGPMVVNLWASWCKPCREEMPLLQEFHQTYGDRVGVLGVNWQDVQTTKAMELVEQTGVTYPLLADPGNELSGQAPLPNLRGLPFFVLVDAQGKVAHQAYVSIKTLDELVELVREHLEITL